MKKVMIAVDGGVLSEATAHAGYELARWMGAVVALVYVVDNIGAMGDSGISAREWEALEEKEGRDMLERLKREMGATDAWIFVEAGSAARTILKLAAEWGADVLVIG
ncbi:MAG TPA: universal stress protein, partial [Puia sp.]|nr:universal stress protein [Puia sp.]